VNAPGRDPFGEFKGELVRVVREEMRGCALTLSREDVRPTGPHNLDAEQEILSALLCEHATFESLKPLESRQFYAHFNQKLFAFLSENPERDLQLVADGLNMCGPLLEELTTIRDCSLFAGSATLAKHVSTVMNHWLERELIQVMQHIDAELRVGALTHDGARARLRAHFVGNSG